MLYTINFVVLMLLTLIWSKSNWLNFFIKTSFFGLSVANAFFAAQHFGYIVNI